MDSLYKDQVKLTEQKIWAEPLLFKFSYHASTLLKLFHGTELPFVVDNKELLIFDEPSALIIFRTCLENYLTFFYLYSDKIPEDQKDFRISVWRYCGLLQRQQFMISSEEAKKKQLEERELLSQLRNEIIRNKYFLAYPKKSQDLILDGKKVRLFETWFSLITKSGLPKKLFGNLYGYKSNYSHSEFISVIQIREGKYGHTKNNTRGHHTLFLTNALISKLIIEFTNTFTSTQRHFTESDKTLIAEIEYLDDYLKDPKLLE